MMNNTCGVPSCNKVVKSFYSIRYFDLVGFCSRECEETFRAKAKDDQRKAELLKKEIHSDFKSGTSFTPPQRR